MRYPLPSALTSSGAVEVEPIDLRDPALYINREQSWLEFNARVLAQARDTSHPLLERVKFLSIVAKNLDEFYMIRIATTVKRLRAGVADLAPDGLSTDEELLLMRDGARRMLDQVAECWQELRALLEQEGIHFLEISQWTPKIREYLAQQFSREICPLLTPLAIDPGHPFPAISNLSKNFAVVVKHRGRTRFAEQYVHLLVQFRISEPGPAAMLDDDGEVLLRFEIAGKGCPGSMASGVRSGQISRENCCGVSRIFGVHLLISRKWIPSCSRSGRSSCQHSAIWSSMRRAPSRIRRNSSSVLSPSGARSAIPARSLLTVVAMRIIRIREILRDDRQELDPLEQWMEGVARLCEHARVELKPALFPVYVKRRIPQVDRLDFRGPRLISALGCG